MAKILLGFIVLTIFYTVQGYYLSNGVSERRPPNTLFGLGGSQECAHSNTTYGKRIYGDWKAYSEVFSKSKSIFFKTSLEVKYPSNGSRSYCPISFMNIENLYRKCNCYKEKVEITSGGLGYGYVTLKITSDRNCPNNHRVTVYTKC